jgi:hypothetical protein
MWPIDAVRVLFNTAHSKHGPWRLPYLFGTRALKELHPTEDVDALIVQEMRSLRVAYVRYCTGNDCSRLFSRSRSSWRLEYNTTYSTPGGAELMVGRVGAMQAAIISAGINISKGARCHGLNLRTWLLEYANTASVAGRRLPWTRRTPFPGAPGVRCSLRIVRAHSAVRRLWRPQELPMVTGQRCDHSSSSTSL